MGANFVLMLCPGFCSPIPGTVKNSSGFGAPAWLPTQTVWGLWKPGQVASPIRILLSSSVKWVLSSKVVGN